MYRLKLKFQQASLLTQLCIFQLAMSTSGVSSGASFGLFTFGMFYTRGNSKVRS